MIFHENLVNGPQPESDHLETMYWGIQKMALANDGSSTPAPVAANALYGSAGQSEGILRFFPFENRGCIQVTSLPGQTATLIL